eukprot:442885-Hanusia_phi.AAC.1
MTVIPQLAIRQLDPISMSHKARPAVPASELGKGRPPLSLYGLPGPQFVNGAGPGLKGPGAAGSDGHRGPGGPRPESSCTTWQLLLATRKITVKNG